MPGPDPFPPWMDAPWGEPVESGVFVLCTFVGALLLVGVDALGRRLGLWRS